jgi:hypothetical protein
VDERAPSVEREAVLPRQQGVDVEAVGGDDRDRQDEEDDEPPEREAEQRRCRQVEPETLSTRQD